MQWGQFLYLYRSSPVVTLPSDASSILHTCVPSRLQVGRAGRDGSTAHCWAWLDDTEYLRQRALAHSNTTPRGAVHLLLTVLFGTQEAAGRVLLQQGAGGGGGGKKGRGGAAAARGGGAGRVAGRKRKQRAAEGDEEEEEKEEEVVAGGAELAPAGTYR